MSYLELTPQDVRAAAIVMDYRPTVIGQLKASSIAGNGVIVSFFWLPYASYSRTYCRVASSTRSLLVSLLLLPFKLAVPLMAHSCRRCRNILPAVPPHCLFDSVSV